MTYTKTNKTMEDNDNMQNTEKRYYFTESEYNALTDAMINNPHALQILQRIANRPIYVKEELSDKKMRELFGANYYGLVYYNFEEKSWNKNTYMGHPISNQHFDTNQAIELKRRAELDPAFKDLEIIAIASITIDSDLYPGWSKSIFNPTYLTGGGSIVSTIVRRDRHTGKILPVSNEWMGVRQSKASSGFTFNGFRYWDFRHTFNRIHGRTK